MSSLQPVPVSLSGKKKPGSGDAASQEGRADYLQLVAELTQTNDYHPRELVDALWDGNKRYWYGRSLLGGALFTALVAPPLYLVGATESAVVLPLGIGFFLLWVPFSLLATRDALVEERPLGLVDQLRRWGDRLPELFQVLALHVLPLVFLDLFLVGLASGIRAQEQASLLILLMAAVTMANYPYAACEVLLTHRRPFPALRRAARARLESLLGGGLRRHLERFQFRQILSGGVGQPRLLPTLLRGGVLALGVTVVSTLAALGIAALLVPGLLDQISMGWGVPDWLPAVLLLAGATGALLAADYTACRYAGHYLVFLADRLAEGELLALSRARGEAPPGALPAPPPGVHPGPMSAGVERPLGGS